MSEPELDAQKVIDRLSDLLASQQVIATALGAVISNHPNRQAVADSLHRHLPPAVRTQAANATKGRHTAALLRAIDSALKGGYQPPRQPPPR